LLLHELDHVAPHPAAEAVVELLARVHGERRRALLVEWAQAGEPLAAPAQVGVRGDDLDDVGRVLDALDRVGSELAHSLDSSGRAMRFNVAMQKPSGLPATYSGTRCTPSPPPAPPDPSPVCP